MKYIIIAILLIAGPVFAGSYDNSPYNYNNSEYNYQNSEYNPKNSPYNYDNSAYNPSSTNSIYDSDGDRVGYTTEKAGGGYNYYSEDGDRIGYSS